MCRRYLITAALALLILALFGAELSIGVVAIPLKSVVASLSGGEVKHEAWLHIVRDFRLPRALTALVSGASLGACGLMLQTLFRNPPADPFVLGTRTARGWPSHCRIAPQIDALRIRFPEARPYLPPANTLLFLPAFQSLRRSHTSMMLFPGRLTRPRSWKLHHVDY